MKRMVLLVWLVLFAAPVIYAEEKINAPVWNVGDKWVFAQGNIEVIGADKKSYALRFSKDTCIAENGGFETIIFDKSTLNRSHVLKEDKREKYTLERRRILNFPFNPGKQWQDIIEGKLLTSKFLGEMTHQISESFGVLGWEDVEVRAGKFKAIKMEYMQKITTPGVIWHGTEGWIFRYWYSPNAKYFVKCQYDKNFYIGVEDWELVSFILKK